MASYYNPSKRLSEWAAALLSPYIKLESEEEADTSDTERREQARAGRPSPSSLSVGLWTGKVELKNVELRPEAFEKWLNRGDIPNPDSGVQIRWKLVRGTIDAVKVRIPWKSLLVGSAYSSSNYASGERDEGEAGDEESTKVTGDTEEESISAGCTTVQVQGVKLLLGYDIIHHDPFLNAMQNHNESIGKNAKGGDGVSPPGEQLKEKIREEKKRILQSAERRLLAGLDPFPPQLMEELQSLVASSIQSSAILATPPSTAPSDNDSTGTANTRDTQSKPDTYMSRVEHFLSSTIRSLIWRVFDSLSLSVIQVQVSVMGHSHYDKDFASLMRKIPDPQGERSTYDETTRERQRREQKFRQQQQRMRKMRQFSHRGGFCKSPPFPEEQPSERQTWPSLGRGSSSTAIDEADRNSIEWDATKEDPSIWAREGQVEVGLTLDQFNVRPGQLAPQSSDDKDDGSVSPDSAALKLMRFQGVGVFIKKRYATVSIGKVDRANLGVHTGRTLAWNDLNADDYIVSRTNMEASCKISRGTGSFIVGIRPSSPRKNEERPADAITAVVSTATTTRRRGKRDREQKVSEGTVDVPAPSRALRQNASPTSQSALSPLSPEKGIAPVVPKSNKRSRPTVISDTAPLSATTGRSSNGAWRQRRASLSSASSLHQVELCLKMGHVRSCLSPRQIFLVHSLSSSMARIKRGRPPMSIRTALADDRALRKRMAEEGHSLIEWEDHIYREVPSLRSASQSVRSLPRVVSSWWKYALSNIVSEIRDQKALLGRCRGEGGTSDKKKRRSILQRSGSAWTWDWALQSRIRREYIDLYLLVHVPPQQRLSSTESPSEAVVAAAALRLQQLEEELSVERALLLKNVARAASIGGRSEAAAGVGQSQDLTSAANAYYYFPLHGHATGVAGGPLPPPLRFGSSRTLQSTSSRQESVELDVPFFQEVDTPAKAERNVHASTLTAGGNAGEGNDTSLSFSAQLFLSGFSVAICEFDREGPPSVDPESSAAEQLYQQCPPDDISALTGYSDNEDDPKIPQPQPQLMMDGAGDQFDPLCLWPSTRHGQKCTPIAVMHIADVCLSARNAHSGPPHVEKEFSIGGIALHGEPTPLQQHLFCMGRIQIDGSTEPTSSLFSPSSQTSASHRPIGLLGHQSGRRELAISVRPAKAVFDWEWLEKLSKFASLHKDIGPSRFTVPLHAEALIDGAFSDQKKEASATSLAMTLAIDDVSFVVPVHREVTDDRRDEKLCLVASARQLHFKSGNNLRDGKSEEPSKHSPEVKNDSQPNNLPPSRDMIVALESFDFVIASQEESSTDTTSRVDTRLLRHPISLELRHTKGEVVSSCARSPAIDILVSESRLRTLIDMSETISTVLSKAGAGASANPLRPYMPALTEYVLAEMKLSAQSLSIQIVPDGSETELPAAPSAREGLEAIAVSFISQLSCLDLEHPNPKAISCMINLAVDRCCALGLAEVVARKCIEAARANFDREVTAIKPSSIHDTAKSRRQRRRTAKRKTQGRLAKTILLPENVNPDNLSQILDQAAGKALETTMAELGEELYIDGPGDSEHNLAVNFNSMEASASLYYSGNMLRVNAARVAVKSRETILLKVQPQGFGSPASQRPLEKKPSSDDTALSLSLRDRNDLDHGCRRDIYFELGNVASNFAPEAFLETAKACRTLEAPFEAKKYVQGDEIDRRRSPTRIGTTNGNISSFSAVLTDNFTPFIECRFHDVTVESQTGLKAKLHAGSASFDCAYQAAYPSIISSYQQTGEDGFAGPTTFSIERSPNQDASRPSEVLIALDGVRVTVLRQMIDDILQYTLSPNRGIGRFLNGLEAMKGTDAEEAPSPPAKVNVLLNNSSVVLPRDSQSIDMVGMEVDAISISLEQVAESWSIDRYSFSKSPGEVKHASSSSSDLFFDCVDGDQSSPASSPLPLRNAIRRFAVQLRGAHIFTALNKDRCSLKKTRMPEFNEKVQHTGRIKHNAPPFSVRGKMSDSMSEDISGRLWAKITEGPLHLGIKADYAPTLRLLVEDISGGGSEGVSLDMRMSQFYLLMSIWYSNMKELPLMFPFEKDYVEKNSTDSDPPSDWPEYGTKEFVKRLKYGGTAKNTFEMALCIRRLRWRCSYDPHDYFSAVPPSMFMMHSSGEDNKNNSITVELTRVISSIIVDDDTLQRIGLGATSIWLQDERQGDTSPAQNIAAKAHPSNHESFVDLSWGLDWGRHTLVDGLPLPFQVTVFLTLDQHCLINLGLDMAEAALVNLAPIWILLDYFGLYFKDAAYGHPGFEAEQMMHDARGATEVKAADEEDKEECLDIDFRMWMIKPHVIIPSSLDMSEDLCVMVEAGGLHYRYKSLGANYSSQDVVARDLGIVMLREYMEPSVSRGLRQVSGSFASSGVKTLVDGLSFGLKYDYNLQTNYTSFALRVPLTSQHFDSRSMEGIESSNIEPRPFCVPPPLVCKPFVSPSRTMGHHETRIYFSQEYMKVALDTISAFVGPKEVDESEPSNRPTPATDDGSPASENAFSATVHAERIKLVLSDPVMGMHRPILSVCFPSFFLSASQLREIKPRQKTKIDKLTGRGAFHEATDLQASLDATVFCDYFKLGLTRNWEPFVEPFTFLALYERSSSRGKGVTFNADCPLHFNVTGALVETIDDATKSFDLFQQAATTAAKAPRMPRRCSSDSGIMQTESANEWGRSVTVLHKTAERLEGDERTAFSLKNITGEGVRVHRHSALETSASSSQTTIMYLDHLQLMPLSFPATETVIIDLQSIEVPFKGDQNVSSALQKRSKMATSHDIDLQLPGFQWVRGISFDKAGKHFVPMVPRALSVQAKIQADWRLENALHLLAEVNFVNGGRRLTVKSPFEVINKTDHPIVLAISPDPRHSPDVAIDASPDTMQESEEESKADSDCYGFTKNSLDPDEVSRVSPLLLESALRLNGNHLGSIWIRPDQSSSDDFPEISRDLDTPGRGPCTVGYPTRPLQLAKILHESSVIFREANGDPSIANRIASGIEVSCPIFDGSKSRSSKPFCYVVEVKRSPIVRSAQAETANPVSESTREALSPVRMGKGLKTAKTIFSRNPAQETTETHAPIAYSLVIHPPIVIENLLPERGRFELMDAAKRNVLWWGSLEAGEKVPVHSVGLDSPLLLLVNLGFCRTAVGEGALVHHGGGDGLFKAGWNAAIGSAMKTSKDRVKRTLNTMTESKDDRGAKRVGMVQTGNVSRQNLAVNRKAGQLGFNTENEIIESAGRGVLRRGDFAPEDIATELCVIDSLGQRLTLNIDNEIGSGGQRRIALYSPFWIVNTTEHALRYKQEKALSYVSGTVLSPEKDGSKAVDGSDRNDLLDEEPGECLFPGATIGSINTIFSGRPGALALLNDLDDDSSKPALLAALISEDLPMRYVSRLAFMFNFQDVLSIKATSRLCLQLADGATDSSRYTSAWSSGFGLESVGVTQIVAMLCKEGRGLEVSVSISVAPGRLSKYTKIVRICPRYIVVNQLPRPIRLWQDNSVLHPNLAIEHAPTIPNETRKWIFTSSDQPDGIVNQYELLFGSPTKIAQQDHDLEAQTTAHHDACFIATVAPSHLAAFHLPDTRLERLLRVDFGPSWYLSPSFAADITGEYVLNVSRARDLRMLPHASSRGAPVYTVTLPPTNVKWNGDLGVWFETDWGRERTLVVKGIREGSFASYFSDIIVGDELIMIDAVPVEQLTFDEAMKHLKVRLAAAKDAAESRAIQLSSRPLQIIGRNKTKKRILRAASSNDETSLCDDTLTLTFLTLEERRRRLRRAAVNAGPSSNDRDRTSSFLETKNLQQGTDLTATAQEAPKDLLVDMKMRYQSVFVFLREPDARDPPHRVINRSLHWVIYYRQKACDAHPWKSLSPGESAAYTWEETLKAKKLSVRVGVGERIDGEFGEQDSVLGGTVEGDKKKRPRPLFSFQFIENEEQGHFGPTRSVRLEEIGSMDRLPCPRQGDQNERFLHCRVDTEGATRVLIISDEVTEAFDSNETLVRCNLANIRKQIAEEEVRRAKLDALHKALLLMSSNSGPAISPKYGRGVDRDFEVSSTSLASIEESGTPANSAQIGPPIDLEAIEPELEHIADHDEGRFITKRNQVLVEVIEAIGLRSSDLNGLSNPYVKVGLVSSNKKRRASAFRHKARRSTYFVEKTLSPQWSHQSFVFDVPANAAFDPKETRRHAMECRIFSIEKLGKDKFLGQAHVHLRNLKDQQEHTGWYPLMGKLGQGDAGKDPLDRICGSIRLRVQWVYDYSALSEYYLLCAERRLEALRRSKDGTKRQLKALQDEAEKEKDQRESNFIAEVPALTLFKRKKGKSFSSLEVATATEDKSSQPLVTKGTQRLKKAGMRLMAASKLTRRESSRAELIEKRNAFSSKMGSGYSLGIDDYSSSDDDLSDSSLACSDESVVYDAGRGLHSPIHGHSGNYGDDAAVSPNTSPFRDDSQSDHQPTDHRVLCLRWHNWEHHGNRVESPPFYKSWNLSRAFVNSSRMKSQGVKNRTPFVPLDDGTDAAAMAEFLKVPPAAPHLVAKRAYDHGRDLLRSRTSFSKAARRSLGSVLNPGGVLTIRPITALNLPESYTGVSVKLRYGTRICLSETVDSRVAPVWTDESSIYSSHALHDSTDMKRSKRTLLTPRRHSVGYDGDMIADFSDIADMMNPATAWGLPRKNDLIVRVGAFETGRSVRLTVIGERLQSKVEIGVLEIPLGPALECCAQSMEDYEEDRNRRVKHANLPPAYVRWFPLMSPSEAVPIEGDMGKSIRPLESEKVTDDRFGQYFAPCIKLALMFRPDEYESDWDEADSTSRSSTDQYLYARLNRLSAAVIDSSRIMELLSFSSRDADLRISVTSAKTRFGVAVGNVQIDQQSSGTNAVILAPTPVKHPQPTVQFLAWKDNVRSKSDMDSYEYIAMQVEEMDLKIEESWLFDVWAFYLDVMRNRERRVNVWKQDSKSDLCTTTFEAENSDTALDKASLFLREGQKAKRKKIYVRELLLGFAKVNLSYFKSKGAWGTGESDETPFDVDLFSSPYLLRSKGAVDQQGADAFRQWSEDLQGDGDERAPGINIISAVFPSISEAPIRFQERQILHVFESEGDIFTSLKSFYTSEALSQIYKIVGSLDFVGNPTMVLTSFRTGLRDFFLQPSRELRHITKNPSRVGVGVMKGTLSLLSNSASGIFGFASNLGATVGHTATMLTLDEHFQRLHSEQKAAQQRHYDRWKKKGFGHVTLMISRPVHDILFGVLSATTGLITEPYRGAKRGGAVGLAKGSAIGVIGVVVKPIVGISDAFSHVMESAHDMAKSANLLEGKWKSRPIERYRLPYVFGSRRMLLPFRQVDSRTQMILAQHPLDKKMRKGEEVIVACEALHMGNGIDDYVVVTTMRVALFRLKVIDGQGFVTVSTVWQVRFEKGASITSSLGNRGHNGSVLYVSRYSAKKGRGLDEAGISGHSMHKSLVEETPELRRDEDQRSDFFFEGEGRGSNPETPKSFHPLGPATSAFKLRTAWPFAAAEGSTYCQRFAVEGNFQHRTQLSRIHNAICCLSGDFDSIIYEGNRHDRSDGTTTFGPLIFERSESPEMPPNRDLRSFYSSMERTVWKTSQMPDEGSSLLGASTDAGWLTDSRARGMHIPPSGSELEDGLRTPDYDSVSHEINSFVSESNEIQSVGSSDFSSLDGLCANDDFDAMMPSRASPTHQRSDASPMEVSSPQEKLPMIDETLPAEPSELPLPTSPLMADESAPNGDGQEIPGLGDRLRRVEEMLEILVGGDRSLANLSHDVGSIASPASLGNLSIDDDAGGGSIASPAQVASLASLVNLSHDGGASIASPTSAAAQTDEDHLSATSSTFNPFNSPAASHQSQGDTGQVDALLKEVEDLKRQLAARNSSALSEEPIPDGNGKETPPTEDPSPEPKRRSKIRRGIRRIFH